MTSCCAAKRTGHFARREKRAEVAGTAIQTDQRDASTRIDPRESPGNPANKTLREANRRLAESEVAVGAVGCEQVSAAGGRNSLLARENTGKFRDSAPGGEAGATGTQRHHWVFGENSLVARTGNIFEVSGKETPLLPRNRELRKARIRCAARRRGSRNNSDRACPTAVRFRV